LIQLLCWDKVIKSKVSRFSFLFVAGIKVDASEFSFGVCSTKKDFFFLRILNFTTQKQLVINLLVLFLF